MARTLNRDPQPGDKVEVLRPGLDPILALVWQVKDDELVVRHDSQFKHVDPENCTVIADRE